MNFSLSSDLSVWYIPICFLFAVMLTGLLYYKNTQNSEWGKLKKYLLVSLRFITTFLIALLVLNFVMASKDIEKNKPVIVIAQDNSQSIALIKDSSFRIKEYEVELNTLAENLSASFEVLRFDFGNEISKDHSFSFDNSETNFSQLFDLFSTQLYQKNVKALIISSDGINNKGNDPINAAKQLKFPLYVSALGDTIKPKDVFIDKVFYNEKVYKGNKFPVFVNVIGDNAEGDTIQISISGNEGVIESEQRIISQSDYFEKIYFQLSANDIGAQSYDITISDLKDEQNSINNRRKIVVDVRDDKQKILLLQDGFSPDASAFKQVFQYQQSYEFTVKNIEGFSDDIQDYALVILNQLPNKRNNLAKLYKKLLSNKTPLLFIVGEQSHFNAINNFGFGFRITQKKNLFDDVKAALNHNFSLFTLDIEDEVLNSFPPLRVPFADYSVNAANNVLFYQQLGNLQTEKPLIYLDNLADQKIGVIFGEGIWRWRLQDYRMNKNHDATSNLITKIVQYLALNENKERLSIDYRLEYEDSKRVKIGAKLYNASYELINTPDIDIVLKDDSDKEYNLAFSRNDYSYELDLGRLNEGTYQFKAETKIGDEKLNKEGSFVVLKHHKEHLNLKANHHLLYQLAKNSGGKVYYPQSLSQLELGINNSISKEYSLSELDSFEEILNLKWLFVVISLLIFIEWFLRKYWGGV